MLYNSKAKPKIPNHTNHLLSHSTHHQYFLYLLQNHLYQYVHFPPSYLCQKVRFLNIFDHVAHLLSLHCCCLVEMILRLDDPWHQPADQSCLLHQLRSFHQVAFSHGWAEMLKPGQILFAKINISSDFFLSALIEESNNFRLFVQFCEFFIWNILPIYPRNVQQGSLCFSPWPTFAELPGWSCSPGIN